MAVVKGKWLKLDTGYYVYHYTDVASIYACDVQSGPRPWQMDLVIDVGENEDVTVSVKKFRTFNDLKALALSTARTSLHEALSRMFDETVMADEI